MTRDEFLDNVAALVAGLQLLGEANGGFGWLGMAYEPWQKLLGEANGGFGWLGKENCREAFAKILDQPAAPGSLEPDTRAEDG